MAMSEPLNRMEGARASEFERVPIPEFCARGTRVIRSAKRILFEDAQCVELLIGKALVCPHRAEVLDLPRWERAFGRVTPADLAAGPERVIEAFRHALGIASDDLEGVPVAAFHSGLGSEPILGQNRIGYMAMGNVDFNHGLMLGGLGTGGIERTPQGSFRRIAITCTSSNVEDLEDHNAATQFHVFLRSNRRRFGSVLCTDPAPEGKLGAFRRELGERDGSYHALYPREWFVYRGRSLPGVVRLRAFSPVLAHDYRESSYPVVIYKITIENTEPEPLDAAIMLTFQNLVGWLPAHKRAEPPLEPRRVLRLPLAGIRTIFEPDAACDRRTGFVPDSHGNYNTLLEDSEMVALVLDRRDRRGVEGEGQIALATPKNHLLEISVVPEFDAMGTGEEIASFYDTGRLSGRERRLSDGTHRVAALAVCARGIPAGGRVEFPLVIAYDFPISQHGEQRFLQRYTRFFGNDGRRAAEIAATALREHERWESRIVESERAVTARPDLPLWARGAVLNRLNLLQTTSIGWLEDGSKQGVLLLSEANKDDYECAETLDVSSYAMARLLFWPKLEATILHRFARSVASEDAMPTPFHESDRRSDLVEAALANAARAIEAEASEPRKSALIRERAWFEASCFGPRKERFAVPHDLWSSRIGPVYNAYTYQNANRWPDLPARAMLQLFRNHAFGAAGPELSEEYAAFARSMRWALDRFDLDGDGLPEFLVGDLHVDPSINISLWTFDNLKWRYSDGINACTAGLWIVAYRAAQRLASELGLESDREFWSERADAALSAFDAALWDHGAKRYRLGPANRVVFADSLHFFYDRTLRLDAFEPARVCATLRAIYRDNVRPFGDGYCGAVNATLDARPCPGEQTLETWTGVSTVLGLSMLAYDMQEGWDVLFGTEALATHRAGHFADWAEAYTLEPGVSGVPAYGIRAKNYLRCLALVNLLAVVPAPSVE
jgi:non-lysosomal glucosylceramidase